MAQRWHPDPAASMGLQGPRGQPGSPSPPAQGPEGPQRPAGRWSGAEVGSWLAAHGGPGALAELAREHALTGRALLRLTEGSLRRMGVTPRSRRRELLRELLRLRLQQEVQELRSIAGGEHPPRRGQGWGWAGAAPLPGWCHLPPSPQSEDDVPADVPEPGGAEEMACEDKAAGTEQHMQEQCWRSPEITATPRKSQSLPGAGVNKDSRTLEARFDPRVWAVTPTRQKAVPELILW